MLAIEKALAEGTLAEIQIVLGWLIDMHRLLISLPLEKFNRWIAELNKVLDMAQHNGHLRHHDLEPLLGRLQHTANILVEGNHFSTGSGWQKCGRENTVVPDFVWRLVATSSSGKPFLVALTAGSTSTCWSTACLLYTSDAADE